MSYLGSWKIDDALTFYANTTRFDTGAATDADAVPAYRVYEDETGTAILTGNMALIDSSNTAGFYSEQITLSAANGFEKGKCYAVYISAAVNSVTGATHHTLQIEAEVDANTVSGTVANVTTVATTTNLTNLPAITANWLTATGIAADAITAAKIADGAIDANTFASGALDAVWSVATRVLTAATNLTTALATPTNITAGTITTVTNLTNNNDKTGYSLSAAGIQAIWDALTSALTTVGSIGKLIVDNLNATISSRSSHSAADVWAAGTRTLTGIDEDSTTLDLDATIRAAVGLASANLDTQLDALPTNAELATALGTADDAVLAAIAALNNLSAAQVNAEVVDVLRTDTIPDSVPADGSLPTAVQALYMVLQFLTEKSVSGTTLTVRKVDGSTSLATYTLDSATAPTSITRAS